MDANCEAGARAVGGGLCGTLIFLPRAAALGTKLGGGAPKRKGASYAFGGGPGSRFPRLIVPEKVNSGRPPDVSLPRRKISEPPARETSPTHSISSPSRAASRKSQAKLVVTAGPSSSWVAIANRQ